MYYDPSDRHKKRRPSKRERFLKSIVENKSLSPEQIAERRLLEADLRLCAAKAGFKLKKSVDPVDPPTDDFHAA